MSIFGRRSVASITASLTKMVEDLKAHAEEQLAAHHKHQALADEAFNEHAKATVAAGRINDLFSN